MTNTTKTTAAKKTKNKSMLSWYKGMFEYMNINYSIGTQQIQLSDLAKGPLKRYNALAAELKKHSVQDLLDTPWEQTRKHTQIFLFWYGVYKDIRLLEGRVKYIRKYFTPRLFWGLTLEEFKAINMTYKQISPGMLEILAEFDPREETFSYIMETLPKIKGSKTQIRSLFKNVPALIAKIDDENVKSLHLTPKEIISLITRLIAYRRKAGTHKIEDILTPQQLEMLEGEVFMSILGNQDKVTTRLQKNIDTLTKILEKEDSDDADEQQPSLVE